MKLTELQLLCKQHGLVLSDKQLSQYDRYAHFLIEYNQKVNLTAITDYEDIIEKHFYDSLLPSFMIGAGFPSIPLKIAYPNLKVTILEPLHKRCVFLTELVKQLELDNVIIKNVRAEDYAQKNRESYKLVTARAVANLSVLAELCIPLVKVDGIFLAMKGANGKQEAIDASNALKTLKVKLIKQEVVELSNQQTRVNMAYQKLEKTAKKYPRAYAKIKKQPL